MSIQRNTIQRQIVLNTLKKMNAHPSIDEIYDEIRMEHPVISKTTIYRNLRQLAKGGTIRRVTLPDGLERYDRSADCHYHFRCKGCGDIYDLDIPYLSCVDGRVQAEHGFQIDGHDIVFSGSCQKCKKKTDKEVK